MTLRSNSKVIDLTQGQVALVDPDDYEWARKFKWCAHRQPNGRWYAIRNISWDKYDIETIRMHREIMCARPGQIVDHINRNGLDNRKSNLRLCTNAQNLQNAKKKETKSQTSKYKGVHWNSEAMKWRAVIALNRKTYYLGSFDDEKEAALAYDMAAIANFGEFARVNFDNFNKNQNLGFKLKAC